MRLGYSTNSLGDIPPLDALPILRDLGYGSIAITLDHHLLNPFAGSLPAELDLWRKALAADGMACVIETGGRHLLDPVRKHEPTLVSADPAGRERRVELLTRAIDVAAALGAGFLVCTFRVLRDQQNSAGISLTKDAPARAAFKYSIMYLFVLFAALAVDHFIG